MKEALPGLEGRDLALTPASARTARGPTSSGTSKRRPRRRLPKEPLGSTTDERPSLSPGKRRPGRRTWAARWKRFRRTYLAQRRRNFARLRTNPSLIAGLALLLFFASVAITAPFLYPGSGGELSVDSNVLDLCATPSAPTISWQPFGLGPHPLGQTSHLGLDVAQGLLLGTRWDLLLVGVVVGLSALIGGLLGAVTGAKGGGLESALSPVFDGTLAFPPLLIMVTVLGVSFSATDQSFRTVVFIAGMLAVLWAPFAQGVRAQARNVARQPYVEAARASGAGWPRVLLRHVLPNCASSIFSQVPSAAFNLLLVLGLFQYLGLVASPYADPVCSGYQVGHVIHSIPSGYYLIIPSYRFPEWTWVLANGLSGFTIGPSLPNWWSYLLPSAWIGLFFLMLTLLCDGLSAHLSPYRPY